MGRHVNGVQIKIPKKYRNISFLLSHGAAFSNLIYGDGVQNKSYYPLDISYCGNMIQPRNLYLYGTSIDGASGVTTPIPSVCETVLIFNKEDSEYMYFTFSGGGASDNTVIIVCN